MKASRNLDSFLESRDLNYDPAVKLFVSFIKTAETKIYFKILLVFTSFILMLLMAGVMLYAKNFTGTLSINSNEFRPRHRSSGSFCSLGVH